MNQFLTKMKYQYHINYKGSPGEIGDPFTKTKQGQSYTVQEALDRVSQGLPVSTGRKYLWAEEGDESIPMRMKDLTDLDNAKNQLDEIKRQAKEKKKDPKKDAPGTSDDAP